ncbi:MAG: hypothetical protein QHH09_00025 [Microgenomates group bacterium]|nr:hypothetical protein [Microgenomates group bacterium]
MKFNSVLSFFNKFFFWLWSISIFLIIGYYLLTKSISSFVVQNSILSFLIQLNFFSGFLTLVFFILEVFFTNIKKLWTKIIFLIILVLVINFLTQQKKRSGSTTSLVEDINTNIYTARRFYQSIFFEVFGSPTDVQMATADEILQAINDFRRAQKLEEIVLDVSLCQVAEKDMSELMAIASKQQYETVRDTELFGNKKIIEFFDAKIQASSAKHIVENRWGRPLTAQGKVLVDPQLTSACGLVTGYNIVFVFAK